MKTGILLHVYNLGCKDWEELVWGVPAKDKLGVGAKLFECLLDEPVDREVTIIIYDGPSHRDGMSEGAYTRQFLLSKFQELSEFPRFKRRLANASPEQLRVLRERAGHIVLGVPIRNTMDEIKNGAMDFRAAGINRIIHVAAASHAPRCIQLQLVARERSWVPAGQQWYTVASDLAFAGTTAEDVFVAEPPHRADDPLLGTAHTLPQILKPFYKLPVEQQLVFLQKADAAMSAVMPRRAKQPNKVFE